MILGVMMLFEGVFFWNLVINLGIVEKGLLIGIFVFENVVLIVFRLMSEFRLNVVLFNCLLIFFV